MSKSSIDNSELLRAPPSAVDAVHSEGFARPGFDFLHYLRVLYVRKWTIIVFLALVLAAVVAWTLRQTPVYRATATVLVELRAPSVLGREVEQVEELSTGSYWNNQEYLQTQYKLIKSRDVTLRVVRALNLSTDPNFQGPEDDPRTELEIAEHLQGKISVEPVRDSRLILVSVEDTSAKRASTIANAVADAYLQQNVERMLSATVEAVEWLSRQLEDLQISLEDSERAVYDFRRERDILSVALEDRQNITANQIQKLSDAATQAQAQRIAVGSRLRELRELSKAGPLDIPIEVFENATLIEQMRNRYNELSREKEGLLKRYGQNWPRVQEIDRELETVRENVSREVSSAIVAEESEYRAVQKTEAGIHAALETVKQEALELNLHEIDYNKLTRSRENNEKMYELVLGRAKETDLTRLLRVNNLRIIDRAVVPERPVKPKVLLNIIAGLFLGLFGGIGLALLLELMDVSIKGQEDIEALDASFLGMVPSVEEAVERRKARHKRRGNSASVILNKDLFVHQNPKSTVAEACKSIRTNLLFMATERDLRTLLVTSHGPQEGKTLVTINLAVVMQQGGARVVIVDTDMRRPRLHKALGASNSVGLSSVIVGQASLDEALQPTQVDGLTLLPCGPVPPNPSELLHTERFNLILRDLTERFDRVIFDSPPIGVVTDAAILGTRVDGVVMVVKSGATRKDAARRSLRTLDELGSRMLGVVLNDVDVLRGTYGHQHYYYRRYGRYYTYGQDQDADRAYDDDGMDQPSVH